MAQAQPPTTTCPRPARSITGTRTTAGLAGANRALLPRHSRGPALRPRSWHPPTATRPAYPLPGLEQQDHHQRSGADRERRPVGFAAEDRWTDCMLRSGPAPSIEKPRLAAAISTVERMPLTSVIGLQSTGVQVPAHYADQKLTSPATTAIMLASATATASSADRGSTHRQRPRPARVRPQHQNAARAEQGVGEQRNDSGVQTVDARIGPATAYAIPTGTSIVVSTRPAIRSCGSQAGSLTA